MLVGDPPEITGEWRGKHCMTSHTMAYADTLAAMYVQSSGLHSKNSLLSFAAEYVSPGHHRGSSPGHHPLLVLAMLYRIACRVPFAKQFPEGLNKRKGSTQPQQIAILGEHARTFFSEDALPPYMRDVMLVNMYSFSKMTQKPLATMSFTISPVCIAKNWDMYPSHLHFFDDCDNGLRRVRLKAEELHKKSALVHGWLVVSIPKLHHEAARVNPNHYCSAPPPPGDTCDQEDPDMIVL